MDDAMRAAFARQGYIVVPDVLNQQQLDELNQVYDQHVLEREETLSTASTDKQSRFYIGGRDKNVTTDGTATPTWAEGSGARPTWT